MQRHDQSYTLKSRHSADGQWELSEDPNTYLITKNRHADLALFVDARVIYLRDERNLVIPSQVDQHEKSRP